jgi:hypothetical protein
MRRVASTLAALLLAPLAWPCTTVCLRSASEVLVGKNYDWDIGDGRGSASGPADLPAIGLY